MAWFSCATQKPIQHNTGGGLSPIGAVLHQAQGNGSLYGWFNNPAAQVSAHFWIAKDGRIEEYVSTNVVAWHGVALNAAYVGVETEGFAEEPLTDAQVTAFAAVMAEGHSVHGWPLVEANANGEPGLGYHRMPGSETSTACPSDLRLSTRPEILRRAGGDVKPSSPAPPASAEPPKPSSKAPPWPGRYFEYPPLTVGDDVRQWQAQMSHRGWSIGVDGQYGPQSEEVCIAFQREKSLSVDGIVGPDTWKAAWEAPVT